MQSSTFSIIFFFLLLLVAAAWGVRWWQRRYLAGAPGGRISSNVVSVVAVGPQQRVVTVETGPEDGRVWLVLGVTGQSINCLHTMPAPPAAPSDAGASGVPGSFAALAKRAFSPAADDASAR